MLNNEQWVTAFQLGMELIAIADSFDRQFSGRNGKQAVDHVNELHLQIHDAGQKAHLLPRKRIVQKVKAELIMARETIGQIETLAEFAVCSGDHQDANQLVNERLATARRKCGRNLERLGAKMLVIADEMPLATSTHPNQSNDHDNPLVTVSEMATLTGWSESTLNSAEYRQYRPEAARKAAGSAPARYSLFEWWDNLDKAAKPAPCMRPTIDTLAQRLGNTD
jgi:hypothetical protein